MKHTYKLHASQLAIYRDSARFKVLAAGRRYGKTTLAIISLALNAVKLANTRNWYIAPTYRQAKMIAWRMLLSIIPAEIISGKNETELSIMLGNGSEINLKGADNPESLKGVGISYAVLDEYAYMRPHVWSEIIRPMLVDTSGRAMFIGTPQGKNAFWQLWRKGEREEGGFKSWRYRTIDNPFIRPMEVTQAQAELPERTFRQEFEASFEDYIGLIWPEFTEQHLTAPFDVPTHWERIGAIDPAISGTTGALTAAIDEHDVMYITGEVYEQDKRISEIAPLLRGRSPIWMIDPAANERLIAPQYGQQLYSIRDEYLEHGIPTINAQNNVQAGINRVAEHFKKNKIKIFSTCKKLIYELERYHWTEERETISGAMTPKPFKTLDHLCDCLRYLVMFRAPSAKKQEDTIERWTEKTYLAYCESQHKDQEDELNVE